MFGAQIRAARLALGINESRLSREAGIQRSQLRDAESDRNITTDTLRKILSRLPNITHLTVQPGVVPDTVEATIVNSLAAKLIATAQELLNVSGGVTALPALPARRRLTADEEISPEEGKRIDELNAAIDSNRVPVAEGM